MDTILRGVFQSNRPVALQRALLENFFINIQPSNMKDVPEVLQMSLEYAALASNPFQQEMSTEIFRVWSLPNLFQLDYLLSPTCVKLLLTMATNKQIVFHLLNESFNLLHGNSTLTEHYKTVQENCINAFGADESVPVAYALASLLLDHPECVPCRADAVTLAIRLVTVVSRVKQSEFDTCEKFAALFKRLEELGNDMSHGSILNQLYLHLSNATLVPSTALCSIVSCIPSSVARDVVNQMSSNSAVKDEELSLAVTRMMSWLEWPKADENTGEWIVSILTGLAMASKFTLLVRLTQEVIVQLLRILDNFESRAATFAVMQHLLLSYQHSPDVFHMIVERLPNVFAKWQRRRNDKDVLVKLAELVYTMIYLHAGFPELYDPVLDALKPFKPPQLEDMTRVLKESRWVTPLLQSFQSCSSSFEPRSETGKTGLSNFGNTCFMNSVLQALFMTDNFRNDVLHAVPRSSQPLLHKLQLTFAFLTHTMRAAYTPVELFKVSRPSWFEVGRQQDCSEYLRHLLDALHEEELKLRKKPVLSNGALPGTLGGGHVTRQRAQKRKSDHSNSAMATVTSPLPQEDVEEIMNDIEVLVEEDMVEFDPNAAGDQNTLVHDSFAGELTVTCRCLNCNNVSDKRETFTDLHLAFPQPTVHPRTSHSQNSVDISQVFGPLNENQSATDTSITATPVNGCTDLLPVKPRFRRKSDEGEQVANAEHCASKNGTVGENASDTVKEEDDDSTKAAKLGNEMTSKNVSENLTLDDLISYYLASETLEGDNKYFCNRCNSLQEAERSIRVEQTPKHLILILLRFSYNTKTHERSKILSDVKYPLVLNFPVGQCGVKQVTRTKSVVNQEPSDEDLCRDDTSKQSVDSTDSRSSELPCDTFRLYGVIMHSGRSSECGHYYTYARLSAKTGFGDDADGDESNKWLLFNDSLVSFSNYDAFGTVTKRFPMDTAYVLLYKKESVVLLEDEDEDSDPRFVPLTKELREAIEKDNLCYFKEQEEDARKRGSLKCTSLRPSWPDSDKPPPGGNCGGGGGFSGFDSGPRMVC